MDKATDVQLQFPDMRSPPPAQLILGVSLDDDAVFDNFQVSAANQEAVGTLRCLDWPGRFVYMHGSAGSGRTHLLQALCHLAGQHGLTAIYLPLAEQKSFGPEILQGIETLDLVCLDDLEAVAGDVAWEQALFSAFNALAADGRRLAVTAGSAPKRLPVSLPDLQSRLGSGLTFGLHALGDEDKLALLRMRARNRGMLLNEEVAVYILKRVNRDVRRLMALLEVIDQHSLETGRRLTKKFVKSLLGQ